VQLATLVCKAHRVFRVHKAQPVQRDRKGYRATRVVQGQQAGKAQSATRVPRVQQVLLAQVAGQQDPLVQQGLPAQPVLVEEPLALPVQWALRVLRETRVRKVIRALLALLVHKVLPV
jgi:hypothetical protein